MYVSAVSKNGIEELKNHIGSLKPDDNDKSLLDGIAQKDDYIILVTPIDESAPKGRMILPQVQMIRDVLNHDAYCIVTKETELKTGSKIEKNLKNIQDINQFYLKFLIKF